MKTLNRTLSLVLVLVMVLGFFGVAGAAFKDDADVQYKEAVDVAVGIGAINGYEDGTFLPKGDITREEAAKLVTYAILGADLAKTLSVSSTGFSDVAAGRWSAPFISYLVGKGVLNGMGDGTFAPTGKVTGYQLGKMLLTAAGYGRNGEYTGASWELNTAVDAGRLGIFAGTKATNFSVPATREEAALYVFNGLTKVGQVAWNKTDELYKPVPEVNAGYDDDSLYTIGEAVYGLKKVDKVSNGVAGYKWVNKAGKEVSGFYSNEAVIGTSYRGTKVSTLATKSNANKLFIAELDAGVVYYHNGDKVTATSEGADGTLFVKDNLLYVANGAAADVEYAVKGAIVNFINLDTDAKAEKVSIVEKTVDFVTAAVVTRTYLGTAQVSIPGVTAGYVDADTVSYPADLAKEDVVLTTTLDGVLYVEKAVANTEKAGKYTALSADGKYTVGGVAYEQSALTGATALSGMTMGTTDYVVYTDNDGGYAVHFSTITGASAKYAVVLDTATITEIGKPSTYQAQILNPDASVSIVTVSADWSSYKTRLVSYTVNSAGAYVYGATATAIADATLVNKDFKIHAAGTYVATTATTFLVRYGAGTAVSPYTYTAYTGYNNLPTLADTSVDLFGANGKAAIVYVDAGTPGASTSNVYLLSTNYGTGYANGVTYREYAAIVDGVAGTIKTADVALNTVFADGTGYYVNVAIPSNGVVLADTRTEVAVGAVGAPFGDGIIKIGSTTYTYSDATVVYVIENYSGAYAQTVTKTTVSALALTNNVNFKLVTGSSTALAEIYIWVS